MAPKGDNKKPAVKAKAAPVATKPKKERVLAPTRMVKKTIGGDKNGGTRLVRVNRMVSTLIYTLFLRYVKNVLI